MTADTMTTQHDAAVPEVADQASDSIGRPSGEETVAQVEQSEPLQADVPSGKEAENATSTEAPVKSRQEESTKTPEQTPPKLNPGAIEFISRSSSTGPGAEGIASQKPNTLTQSRHAGAAGRGQSRRGRQSTPNSRPPFTNPSNDSSSGNPVVLADPVAVQENADVAGMTGFRAPRPAREPRPPRGYVPPAPERKVCSSTAIPVLCSFDLCLQTRLTADELEEKMAKMRLLNERTQAEQEVCRESRFTPFLSLTPRI